VPIRRRGERVTERTDHFGVVAVAVAVSLFLAGCFTITPPPTSAGLLEPGPIPAGGATFDARFEGGVLSLPAFGTAHGQARGQLGLQLGMGRGWSITTEGQLGSALGQLIGSGRLGFRVRPAGLPALSLGGGLGGGGYGRIREWDSYWALAWCWPDFELALSVRRGPVVFSPAIRTAVSVPLWSTVEENTGVSIYWAASLSWGFEVASGVYVTAAWAPTWGGSLAGSSPILVQSGSLGLHVRFDRVGERSDRTPVRWGAGTD
jgi:hypothetical protein